MMRWLFLWVKQERSLAKSMKIKTAWNLFEGVTSCCEVTMSMYDVRGQFWACVTFHCILTSNLVFQPLTSCIFIVSSEGHKRPGIDFWPQTHLSWPLRMVSHPDLISKLFWLSLTWRNCISAWHTKKKKHQVIIDCHKPVNCPLGEDKVWFIKFEEIVDQIPYTF